MTFINDEYIEASEHDVLRAEVDYWRDRAEKLQAVIGQAQCTLHHGVPMTCPPEPPTGTRLFDDLPGMPVWERRSDGWYCAAAGCLNCPEQWSYVWDLGGADRLTRVLP